MSKQRTALVTGATGGLGMAWVRKLVNEDFHVYLAARSIAQAERAAIEGVFATAAVTPIAIDVTNQAHMVSAAGLIKQQFGRLDVLINNAGYRASEAHDPEAFAASNALESLTEEELLKSYRINTLAPLFMMKHFKDLLAVSMEKKVLHMGSVQGSVAQKSSADDFGYSGSKQALVMLNKTAAIELKELGISAVVAHPGWVQTPMGGKNAPLRPTSAIEHVFDHVLVKLHEFETGAFVDRDGKVMKA